MHFENTLMFRLGRTALTVALLATLASSASAQRSALDSHDHEGLDGLLNMHDQEIRFVENKGQFGPAVLYRADFPLGQAVATREGMLMTAFDPKSVEERAEEGMAIEADMQRGLPFRELRWRNRGHGWLMHFRNALPTVRVESKEAHEGTSNYFLGGKEKHATGARSYQEVWYRDVYKGTDVRYYPAADGSLEYDIICKPGSDPAMIAMEMKGIDRLRVNSAGELVMSTSLGEMSYPAPIVYQRINGREQKVEAAYRVSGANVLGFTLGAYDRTQPLVIDPIAMRWATWVNTNSSGDNHGHAIWVDPNDGAIYVVARVVGTTDQITVGAFDESANGNLEIIVGKYLEPATVGASGTRVWQTYIGGGGDDNPYAMEQGPDGNLYISGQTSSTNFPLIGGSAFSGTSINQQSQADIDVFVLKITQDGLSIKAAVLGGNGADDNFDVRTASNGDVFVCGSTTSTNLLTLNAGSGASNTNSGGSDVLLFRINQDLSSLVWLRNYGGSGNDRASIMLHNSATGDLFIGGNTASTNFPTVTPRQATRGGTTAGFLQRIDGGTAATAWSSYFSSSTNNDANLLCMEFNTTKSELYFGGVTEGLAAANITAGSFDTGHNGSNDFYVARMDVDQNFLAGTYVGGSTNEVNMMGLNTDLNNDVFVFGYTNSTNFPVSASPNVPLQTSNQGSNDKVFFKLQSDLSALKFSTYYGGTNDDYDPVGERGIKFSNCRIYTIVTAQSNNIPLTQGALNTTKNSPTSRYEPGLVVWANPPDLLGNTISYQGVSICPGSTPGDIIGSVPSYTLPTIIRNGTTSTYPAFPSAASYQWQISSDSTNWTNINGATGQNLSGAQIGAIVQTTYIRRVIGGDACILAGAADQVVTVRLMSVTTSSTNVSCNGAADGTGTAEADGQAPFSYLWSNGQDAQIATGLAPGSYTVTVTDLNGCSADGAVEITEPSVLGGELGIDPATCSNANGGASVSGTGGTQPYEYLWSTGSTSNAISGVQGGTYAVTITDANDCEVTLPVNIPSTGVPSVDAGDDAVITCSTGPTMQLNGNGSPGVDFAWVAGNGGNIVSGANTATPQVNAAGTYTLTVTDPQTQCSASDAVDITVNTTAPDASITGGGTLTCTTISVALDGGSNTQGATFNWSGPNGFASTDEDVNVSDAGNYVLTVTDPSNGCTNTAQVEVDEDIEAPGASATGGTLTCTTACINLAGSGNGTYSWSGPNNFSSNDQNPEVCEPGTYVLTVTGANGCTSQANADVILDDEAPGASATGGTLTCTTACINLAGSGNGTYSWSGPNNFSSNDQNPEVCEPGTYVLTVTGANGCTSQANAEVDQDSDAPSAAAVGGTITCADPCVTLVGSGSGSFAWTGPNGFTSTEQNPTVCEPGLYELIVTGANGCMAKADAIVDTDTEAPGASATGGTLNCIIECVMLTASGNGSYAWSGPNNYTSTEQNPTVCEAGSYELTVTGANGCTSVATATVDLDTEEPGAQAIGGTLTCATTSVMLQGLGNGTFAWTGPNNFTSNDQNPVVSEAGTYELTVTGVNGCTSVASAEVDLDDEAPGAIATGGTLTCANGSVMLLGVGNGSYSWTGPNNFSSNEQNPVVTVAGTYVLTVTGANGCSSQASAEVDLDEDVPGAGAIGGSITCNNECVTLAGSGNGSYAWSGPNNYTSNEQNPTVCEAGSYELTVTGENGCTSTATAIVELDTEEPGTEATGGTITCDNDCVTLAGSGNGSYAWSGPNNYTSNEQNPTVCEAGSYELTVTGENGCTSTATAVVELDTEAPEVSTQDATLGCSAETVTIDATVSAGAGIVWVGPNNFTSTDEDIAVSALGLYTITATGTNGCTASASAFVSLGNDIPEISLIGGTLTCSNQSVTIQATLDPTGFATSWTGPNNFTSTDEDPVVTEPGTYTLTATSVNGCTTSASVEVLQDEDVPGAQATGGSITCANPCVMLTGSGNGSFSWSGPNNFTSNAQNPEVCEPGTYTLIVTGENGCTSSASAEVELDNAAPQVGITVIGAVTCNPSPVTLIATGFVPGAPQVLWTTPDGPVEEVTTIQTLSPGIFTLTVTFENGCVSTATATVLDLTGPFDLQASSTLIGCEGEPATLSFTSSMEPYQITWFGPNGYQVSGPVATTTVAGTYTVVVLNQYNCPAEASVEVIVDPNCEDECGPLIIWCPPDITVQCAEDWSPFGVAGEPELRKDKKCPELVDVGWTDDILSNCPYVIQRTFWAEDAEGNYEECTQLITVIDEVAPIFMEVPQDISLQCSADIDGCELPSVWAYDECTKQNICALHTSEVVPGECANTYDIVHTWTATDQCGNTGTATWTVHVADTEAPVLECPVEDLSVMCDDIPEPLKCKATDNCDPDVAVEYTEEKGGFDKDCKYVLTRTYTATDDCGNSTSVVQYITVWCPKACKNAAQLTAKMNVSATPNPFREESMIGFTPLASGKAVVEITDLQGRKVAELYNGQVERDVPVQLAFRPAENGSGIFIYRITLNADVVQGRLLFQP